MISIETVVQTFLYLLGCGAIFGILYWILRVLKLPEPWNYASTVFLAVCAGLVLIGLILALMGHPIIRF